jgi:hypothetical protein
MKNDNSYTVLNLVWHTLDWFYLAYLFALKTCYTIPQQLRLLLILLLPLLLLLLLLLIIIIIITMSEMRYGKDS